jgi:hypothetical protein
MADDIDSDIMATALGSSAVLAAVVRTMLQGKTDAEVTAFMHLAHRYVGNMAAAAGNHSQMVEAIAKVESWVDQLMGAVAADLREKRSSPKRSSELTERELDKASGGLGVKTGGFSVKNSGIDGESTEDKHKGKKWKP